MIRVTVWNEFQHERTQEKVKEIYPSAVDSYGRRPADDSDPFRRYRRPGGVWHDWAVYRSGTAGGLLAAVRCVG